MDCGNSAIRIIEDQRSAIEVVKEIASDPARDDPFYVADLSDIVLQHKIWKMNLPRVEPFYAVKCNDMATVLEVLAALGTGFDCASKAEIEKVMDLGVEQSRIIYAHPCKTMSFLRYAASRGVSLMTFDNEQELHKIKAIYPTAELVVRIKVDAKARCPLGIKFGVEPAEAIELLRVAKNLSLNVVGVSFHVGSAVEETEAYNRAIKAARGVFDFAAQLGFSFTLLDVGGGFPGKIGTRLPFGDIANVINSALDKFFPVSCGVRIIAEPGRFYVSSAFTLCANVIAKRVIQCSGEEPLHMYYINDGVYGSFNITIFDHAEVVALPLKDAKWKAVGRCSIWGPTCDSMDRVIEECLLPVQDVGDWLVFEDMGAYTISASSTFNGFQRPFVYFIVSQGTWLYLRSLLKVSDTNVDVCKEMLPMKTGIDVSTESLPGGHDRLLPHNLTFCTSEVTVYGSD